MSDQSFAEESTRPEDAERDVGEAELRGRLEVVQAENRQLRRDLARAKRSRHERAALGLILVGIIAAGAATILPSARAILFTLAGIGLFVGLLTYYLTPERLIPADVDERIFGAFADNFTSLVKSLDLRDERIYVPLGETTRAKLFIPQSPEAPLPSTESLDSIFVVVDDPSRRGISLEPTGAALYREFDRTRVGSPGDSVEELTNQLTEALVEGFEIVGGATEDVDAEHGRVTVRVRDQAYGSLDRFDHPVASFLAVGLAIGLSEPVTVEVAAQESLVTCSWPTEQ